ncbi:MAG: hypothetical protein KatS3mg005_1788 [Bryobacteraceae bacterium]|nr:MAG: hypothetical protein KatS3mg005_1788 [Bryobacteraceae bacterium]
MLSMSTLVSFLGRSQPDNPCGYRPATYAFPGGNRTTTFMGFELARILKPARVVIMGTDASMWDHLVEHLADGEPAQWADSDEVLCARLALIDEVKRQNVSGATLEKVLPIFRDRFQCEVLPRLIPYGRTPGEQEQILQAIAEAVPDGDVHFDVTHGFRHLSMVAFTSAFMLGRLRRVRVQSLWYGALDMTRDGVTPVVKLEGLNQVHEWTLALARFEASGDYGVFAELLENGGLPSSAVNNLRQAAFFERILNVSQAAARLKIVLGELQKPLRGPAELFRETLLARLDWARRGETYDHQRHLAWEYLKRGDLPRAAAFGFEAVLTRLCIKADRDAHDYGQRMTAWTELKDLIRKRDHAGRMRSCRRELNLLRGIRNSLAHGLPARGKDVAPLLQEPGKLSVELERIFECALGRPGSSWPW